MSAYNDPMTMDPDDFVRWIHESSDPEERALRKAYSYAALYGTSKPNIESMFPGPWKLAPDSNVEANIR